jgi:hypothetical protein
MVAPSVKGRCPKKMYTECLVLCLTLDTVCIEWFFACTECL